MKFNLFNASFLFLSTLFVLTVDSCSSDQDLEKSKVNLITSISSSQTRAPQLTENGSGRFSDKDQMRLLIADEKKAVSSIHYTAEKALFWDQLNLRPETQSVTFGGIYPDQEIDKSGKCMFDTQAATDKDLLLATPIQIPVNSTKPQNLVFRHAMHKLEINYTASSDADLKDFQISTTLRGIAPVAVINVLTGKNEGVTDKRVSLSEKGQKVIFMFPPQAVEGVAMELKVKVQGEEQERTYQYSFSKNVTEEAGPLKQFNENNVLRLHLTITRSAVVLNPGTISPWNSQGEITDRITI